MFNNVSTQEKDNSLTPMINICFMRKTDSLRVILNFTKTTITQPVSDETGILTHVVKMVSTKVHTKARVREDDLNYLALEAEVLYYLDPKKVAARFHLKYMEFELRNAVVVEKLIHLGFHSHGKVETFRGQYEELKKRIEGNAYYSAIVGE